MKIELDTSKSLGQPTVILSHRGQSSQWNVSAYYTRGQDKSPTVEDNRMFDEINAYWEQLSPERQQQIWNCYQRARDILDTHYDIDALRKPLMEVVKLLYDLMPIAEIGYWAKWRNIRLPSNLKEHYDPRDVPERTYLRADYQGLVVLAIALRPMLPIWGEFIDSTQKESGNAFKEYQALGLLRYSSLIESEPMQRLRVYITATMDQAQTQVLSSSAVLAGLGSAELPNWMLSLTVVRRLTIGEISARDDNSSLISNIHSYIQNNAKSLDRKIGTQLFGGNGKVSDKTTPDKSAEDQKASIVEMYKVKQEVPDGDLQILNVYTEDVVRMLIAVDESVDPAKLQRAMECMGPMEYAAIQPHQITLVQYVMKCLPARGVPQLNKEALLRSLAVTQACLWEWGFFDLAVLATASPLPVRPDEMRPGIESRGRIPKEIMEELQIKWPHYRQGRGKQVTLRQQNPVAKAVDKFCDLITNVDWQLHAPSELIALSSRLENTKKLIVPADIRAHVARLILKVTQ